MINKQGDENLKEKEKIISLAASHKAEGGLVNTKYLSSLGIIFKRHVLKRRRNSDIEAGVKIVFSDYHSFSKNVDLFVKLV